MPEVRKGGIADSKTVMFAILFFIPDIITNVNISAGANINLKISAKLKCDNSFLQPSNFICRPIENNASGPIVAANLSNTSLRGERLINEGNMSEAMQATKGGKLNTFLIILMAEVCSFPEALIATIIPAVESNIKVTWSAITPMLRCCAPK